MGGKDKDKSKKKNSKEKEKKKKASKSKDKKDDKKLDKKESSKKDSGGKDKKDDKKRSPKPEPNDRIILTCAAKGCEPLFEVLAKDMLDGKHPGCIRHRCSDPDCWRLLAVNSAYCELHTCSIPLCTARCPKKQAECGRHDSCTIGGCKEPRSMGDDGQQRPFCQGHLCEHGRRSAWDCNSQRLSGLRFCEEHQCRVLGGCSGLALRGPYCENHLCRANGETHVYCQSIAERDGYCAEHVQSRTCQFRHCNRIGKHVGDRTSERVYFCSDHSAWRCPGFGLPGLPYCGNYVVDQLPYCEAHRCQVLGCTRVKDVNIKIQWCEDHMCSREDCEERREDGTSLCSEHNA